MKVRMVKDKETGGMKVGQPTKAQSAVIVKEATSTLLALKIVEQAEKLVVERETFEREELARSNKALYAILAKVYTLFNSAIADKCIKDAVKQMSAKLKERGIKVQSNSPALTVFVRYVFNSDRKRAYNYTSTLMAAVAADVKPENLADFIEGSNGVEECKKAYKMKDETKQRIEAIAATSIDVVDALRTMPAAKTVKLPNASVDFSDGVQFAFIVARSIGDGEFELLRAVPKTTLAMQNAAVKELAKDLIESAAKAQLSAKSNKVKSTTEKAVKSISAKDAAKMTVKELAAA
jgi:hypothetical protein